MYLSLQLPNQVGLVQYLDDVLLFSTCGTILREDTADLVTTFQSPGRVVCPKSELEVMDHIQWMGKHIDVSSHTLCSDTSYLAALVMSWISLCTTGYTQRGLRRILGCVPWASRPGHTAVPFLAGAFAWLQWGMTSSKHTPHAVARGLAEAITPCFRPWRAAEPPQEGPRWFVDTAQHKGVYVVGLWRANTGYRNRQAPAWLRSQHSAELYGLHEAIKIAAYRRLKGIDVVGDNLATLTQIMHMQARAPLRAHHQIPRCVHHTLRWSCVQPRMYWVVSQYKPADPVSRALQAHFADTIH